MAKDTGSAVTDAPVNGASGSSVEMGTNARSVVDVPTAGTGDAGTVLPNGFRRLSDLRKKVVKTNYDDLKAWVGKTIRLDNVNIQTEQKDGKRVFKSGEMTFSEFNPADPEQETEQAITSQIPRSALRAIYEGLTKNPDDTIVCDVTQGKRGLSLQ